MICITMQTFVALKLEQIARENEVERVVRLFYEFYNRVLLSGHVNY